jgi:tRNA G37 N-methylase Trm5
MINDRPRNHFYRQALERAVKKGDTVLEIGTGSGLLAMLAARAGPEHVYAVEANGNMAELAEQLIKSNGLDSKITVINALSTEVDVGQPDVRLFQLTHTHLHRPCAAACVRTHAPSLVHGSLGIWSWPRALWHPVALRLAEGECAFFVCARET